MTEMILAGSVSRCRCSIGWRASVTTWCFSCSCTRYVSIRGSSTRGLLSPGLQRWIYRIDPTRVNEYGQVMATDGDRVGDKDNTETKKNK